VTDPSAADAAAGYTYAWGVTKNGSPFATGTAANFTFTPDDAGTYVVTLTATDRDLETSAPASVTITFSPGSGLVAGAGAAATGKEGTAVTFAGSASGGTTPYAYAWDFGDGTTATGTLTPAHTYDAEGKYTVTLTVTDALGHTSTSKTSATIAEVPPTAAITGAPATGHSPEGTAVTLGSTVTDPSAADTKAGFTYAWAVTKDGSAFASGTGAGLTFTPDDTGTYVVTLTAADKDGNQSAPVTTTITADDVAPTVAINGAPANPQPGNPIALTSTVTDPSPVDSAGGFTYAWSVTKDGSPFASGSAASFTFTPDTAATYAVTLAVTDADPMTGTAQQTIVVGGGNGLILLLPSVLSNLQQEAANNTPQWQAFKARLDGRLNTIVEGGYDASGMPWITDFALGYQVLQNLDPTTAAKYADKAIDVMKSALNDYQRDNWTSSPVPGPRRRQHHHLHPGQRRPRPLQPARLPQPRGHHRRRARRPGRPGPGQLVRARPQGQQHRRRQPRLRPGHRLAAERQLRRQHDRLVRRPAAAGHRRHLLRHRRRRWSDWCAGPTGWRSTATWPTAR
jgi:PKD repeat protein